MKSKVLKRALACILATSLFVPVFAGCDGGDPGAGDGLGDFSVAITPNIDAAGTESGAGNYEEGQSATVTATVNNGYVFKGWVNKYTSETLSTDLSYTFTVDGKISLYAHYEREKYDVTVTRNPEDAGTATGAGSYEFGENIFLNATTYAGYEFKGWWDNASPLSMNASHTLTASGNKNYEARWTAKEYAISTSTALVSNAGSVVAAGTVTGAGDYEHGELVTLTATTNTGYTFKGWFEGSSDTAISRNETYAFNALSNRDLTAKWELNSYEITLSQNLTEAGTVTGAGTYNHGDTVTLTATTAAGYDKDFLGWFVEDSNVPVSTDATYTFQATSDKKFDARWDTDLDEYTITVVKSHASAGSIKGPSTAVEGATVTLEAGENAGYKFVGWYENDAAGAELSKAKTYSFTMGTANVKVYARWQKETYAVSVTKLPAAGGTITGERTAENGYEYGEQVKLTATSNPGYEFLGWYGEQGQLLTANENYSFIITKVPTITAKWQLKEYTINANVNVNEGGTVTGGGKYAHGQMVTLTATPKNDYTFTGWFVGGELVSSDTTYTFEATANKDVTAKFIKSGELIVPDGQYTVKLITYVGGYDKLWAEDAARIFEAKYPNFDIVVDGNSLNYWDTLAQQLENNTCEATIVVLGDQHYKKLATLGKLADLTDVLNSQVPGGTDNIIDIIPQEHLNYRAVDVNGDGTNENYGVPWQDNTATGFIYNKTFFTENGLEVPETMEEYFELCDDIIALNKGVAPLTYCGGAQYGYTQNMLNQWFIEDVGYEYMTGTFLKYDNIQNFADTQSTREKAYMALAQMLKTPGYATAKAHQIGADASIDEFLAGKAAMMICGSWFPTESADVIEFSKVEYGFFGVPHINANKKDRTNTMDTSDLRYSLGGNCIAVNANSSTVEKQIAKLFIAEMYSAESLASFVRENNGVCRPLTETPDVAFDDSTVRGRFAKDVFEYFKGTSTQPTKMIYEVHNIEAAIRIGLAPFRTKRGNEDTLTEIITADSLNAFISKLMMPNDGLLDSELIWFQGQWDYVSNDWKEE